MILKDADPVEDPSIRAQAGARAEKDMAFYLRRAFGDHRPDVLVFNDIRIPLDGEYFQIDHLVLHGHGLFLIESKSVSGEIQIMPDGQYIRHYGHGKKAGMASPVLQAKRQSDLLRRLLQAHKAELRERKALATGNMLGSFQGGFESCPIEILVAISDNGIIRGGSSDSTLRKADQVTQHIDDTIATLRRLTRIRTLEPKEGEVPYSFTHAELIRVQRFLLAHHQPRQPSLRSAPAAAPVEPRPQPSPPAPVAPLATRVTVPRHRCKQCQATTLQILFGKYGYYFKCTGCGANTRIDTRIEGSDRTGRIRKSGSQFFLVCPTTGAEHLFFTNPPSAH